MNKTISLVITIILSALLLAGCSYKSRQVANPNIPGKLVFESLREGKGVEDDGIYVLKKGKLQLITKNGGFPKWSPDGKLIACYGKKALWFYDDEGNLINTISTKYQPMDFVWCFDGNSLIYSAREKLENNKYNVYLIHLNLSDKSEMMLKEYINKSIAFTLSFLRISYDNKRLLFHSGTQGENDSYIYVINYDGTNLRQLRKNAIPLFWFPDNEHMAFATNRDEKDNLINQECGRIYKINVDTNELSIIEEITHLLYKDEHISRDGKYMYYARPARGNTYQLAMCPIGERNKEIPITYSYFVNSIIKYTNDWHPDWYEGE